MSYLLLSVALLLPRVLLAPARPRAARVRAYAPQPAHAPTHAPAAAPSRADHAAFCEVAEAHAHTWPEIRRLPGPLYVASDRPNGVQITADNLGAFAAALAAYPGRRNAGVRPYLLATAPPAPVPEQAPR